MFGYCVNSCGGCRSWNGANMVFTTRRRAAFKSNAVVRGTRSPAGFCCKCSARVSAVCFQTTFPVFLVEKHCCRVVQRAPWRWVSRSVAVGMCILIVGVACCNPFDFAKYMWFGFAFVPGYVPCGRRTCFVSACRVSHALISALFHQHDVRLLCGTVFQKQFVHVLWCRHCDQGVETLVKLRGRPRVVGTCGAKLSTGLRFLVSI